MSFILDALKKSEHERQRQSTPGLVETVAARPRQRLPLWALALCALLAINLIVLLVVLARGWMATSAQVAVREPRRAMPSTPTEPGFSPLGDDPAYGSERPATAPVYAPEVPVNPLAPTSKPPPVTRPAPAATAPLRANRHRDPGLTDGDYKSGENETLPSVNELNLTGAQALPELHLDVHVFATNSAERFVFINMRKYHEGATLQEGPVVERIRRDGVVLNYQGLRFLLPRQ